MELIDKEAFIKYTKKSLADFFDYLRLNLREINEEYTLESYNVDFNFNFWQNILLIAAVVSDESPLIHKIECYGISYNSALDKKDRKMVVDEFRDMLKEEFPDISSFKITS